MAHALYLVNTPYALSIKTSDISGKLPESVVVAPGHEFVAEATEPQIIALLASGAISLVPAGADFLKIVPTYILPGGIDIDVPSLANRTSVNYPNTSVGAPLTLLSGTGAPARVALVVAVVTEAFADGSGNQPTFAINKTGSANYFAASSIFTNAPVGKTFVFGGFLAATNAITVTAVAAVGNGTGGLTITAYILPASF